MKNPDTEDLYTRIWTLVSQITRGRVATYGQIATLAGSRRHARAVGYALKCAPMPLPWHRVINAKGEIAFPPTSTNYETQHKRLRREGIPVVNGRVDLKKYRWTPRDREFPDEYFAAET
ncbi:MAG: MGMT family protein [Gammaproteobacteria bacterium]|nr:MGMT family protein [Gammaproteobacteria bacterium]